MCIRDSYYTFNQPDCGQSWDKSNIEVTGWCQDRDIYFAIENTSEPVSGDMQCFSPVKIYVDGNCIRNDSIRLAGGDIDTIIFSGDGRTWRLEVEQNPYHPGRSHPNA